MEGWEDGKCRNTTLWENKVLQVEGQVRGKYFGPGEVELWELGITDEGSEVGWCWDGWPDVGLANRKWRRNTSSPNSHAHCSTTQCAKEKLTLHASTCDRSWRWSEEVVGEVLSSTVSFWFVRMLSMQFQVTWCCGLRGISFYYWSVCSLILFLSIHLLVC